MKKSLSFLFTLLLVSFVVNATVPERKGWWKFDDPADMLKAQIGNALVLTGTQESIDGPVSGNLATLIGNGSYLAMEHGIGANGGGSFVNEYSLQIDFSVPQIGVYNAFYQTTPDNTDDAEMFINPDNFIGAWRFGYSTNTVAQDTWYRLLVTVKNGDFFRIYVNGTIWVEFEDGVEVDGRDALQSVLLLFADEDGEDQNIKCSELGIWDVALTADEALELGDAYTSPSAVDENVGLSAISVLEQNYPNPFATSTTFRYEILTTEDVTFNVLDLTGKLIQSIPAGVKTPGSYSFELISDLPNGTYYLQLTTNQSTSTRKMVIIR